MNREALVRAARSLRALPDAEVLDALDRAASRWTDGHVESAAGELARQTGASEAMLRFGLRRTGDAHHREALERWLREARREADVETGASGCGPLVIAQILAGNVAGLALPAVFEALLARSAVAIKPASADPVTPARVLACLHEVHPVLAAAVAVTPWVGGDVDREREVLKETDFVVASGETATVDAIGDRVNLPFLGYGSRFSIGLVDAGGSPFGDHWFEDLSREVALWDQAGCLSPRVLVVLGDRTPFARSLAEAMRTREALWPIRPRDPGVAAEVHAFRARYEMGDGERLGIEASRGTEWTVVWDRERHLEPGPAVRVLRLVLTEDLGWLERAIRESPEPIQGCGLGGWGARTREMEQLLARWGVPRVTALTGLQDPPAGWRADGRSGLASLLRAGTHPESSS